MPFVTVGQRALSMIAIDGNSDLKCWEMFSDITSILYLK